MKRPADVLLFLDFDGVLHHWWPRADRADDKNKHFAYLPRLEAVLRDYPSVVIVVSSDWRIGRNIEQIRSFFSEKMRARIVGTTDPVRPVTGTVHPREHQVRKYLEEHGQSGTKWVALDDDPENFSEDVPLVLCADEFSDREERELRSMLSALIAERS